MNNHAVADKEAQPKSELDTQQVTTEAEAAKPSSADVVGLEGDDDTSHADEPSAIKGPADGRRLSISLKTLARAAVVLVLVAGIGVLAWLYLGARSDLANQSRQIADNATGRADRPGLCSQRRHHGLSRTLARGSRISSRGRPPSSVRS